MNSMDQQVIKQLSLWLEAGKQCWLCTIVSTFGSSPRPVGSLLACNEDGQYCGSLSGGCVEDDLREDILKGKLAKDKPERISYGVAVEDVLKLGLPCGGQLEVIVEPLNQGQTTIYQELAQAVAGRKLITRIVDLKSGQAHLQDSKQNAALTITDDSMQHTYGSSFQLLLIGAVQVAYYLSEMAQGLDYEVAICDPRQELIDSFPKRDIELTQAMPDDWLRSKSIDQQTAIVALCHDPRIDDMALMQALQMDAFYIGAMGSAKTTEKRKERLQMLDIPAEQIHRLHAPVGLDIGSKTPPEIAIAILAELTQLRAQLRQQNHA
jgi:xanthine dehydrogenase accessory factor